MQILSGVEEYHDVSAPLLTDSDRDVEEEEDRWGLRARLSVSVSVLDQPVPWLSQG